ncbi:putative 2-oxoisovalerate dehydrogenase subunit alpha, mitochondrial precursor [Toxoplasma gondii TgCatPRC2]|uniref:2-oxoisovalerate dehydrogenase subunit alpha n=8 Tax=Toxoplasma gondii TaxID=5811 RepID=B6KL29_TOXGV|nr:2-oxoisovalerate dehydrogenase subunit alpha, putative [Toxoplasma gondii ME49]ESS33980.1 putative 2-oxoisovalerate dehydrogenase subunit alpha [Toxoplasma gondii VEG]KFG62909.1 putative 2-oxoisovalerate dehydrogenase subunit alpha, mitochondrial precursor [Toxoplasma gondii RUB]KFH05818.1 putative 2-oxoisovalerate dehydrogenase subunit alpha, mitochondrial precursor [Toxoplasma gondii MAS]KYF44921.1 putative 2-oxoisovalerate dehydrogenase subunit alpha, mitochondrial precursor [Toxoplasma g|eukprot:XP_002368552.1 2-oxoisovalerate dehydrogenase subunit alpha, putative [Toxoplasma gondii ME49]
MASSACRVRLVTCGLIRTSISCEAGEALTKRAPLFYCVPPTKASFRTLSPPSSTVLSSSSLSPSYPLYPVSCASLFISAGPSLLSTVGMCPKAWSEALISRSMQNVRYASSLPQFRGIFPAKSVTEVYFARPEEGLPLLRCLSMSGALLEGPSSLPFPLDLGVRMLRVMIQSQVYDSTFYDIQRQGRISFYMTSFGEEASLVGSAAALHKDDLLLLQYRELSALMWRGLTLDDILAQLFATKNDPGKGRQMPVHYGATNVNMMPICSPLAVKIPQGAGVGYAYTLQKKNAVAVVYFGEGAASEGDASVGFNFAATLGSQTLFLCRNNGYAISTPVGEQYKGDGVGARAVAYGIDTVRVDGTDLVAVYAAVKAARELVVAQRKPAFVEMMTYRIGHHSTSDESGAYRSAEEVEQWQASAAHPIRRFATFLTNQGRWSAEEESALVVETRKEVLAKIRVHEKMKHPPVLSGIFSDVYSTVPQFLREQREMLKAFLSRPGRAVQYNLEGFERDSDDSCK